MQDDPFGLGSGDAPEEEPREQDQPDEIDDDILFGVTGGGLVGSFFGDAGPGFFEDFDDGFEPGGDRGDVSGARKDRSGGAGIAGWPGPGKKS